MVYLAVLPTCEKIVQKLDAAEKKADFIIDEAKKNRKALIAKAREAATAELQAFAAEQDALYKSAAESSKEDHSTRDLEAATKAELQAVESDFERNRERTVEYVVGKVLDVPLALTSTQGQALIAEGSSASRASTLTLPGVLAHKNTQTFDVFTPHARKESMRTFDMATPSAGNRQTESRKSTRDSVSVVDSWIGHEGESFNISPRGSRVGTSFSMGPGRRASATSFTAIAEEDKTAIEEGTEQAEEEDKTTIEEDAEQAEEEAAEPAAEDKTTIEEDSEQAEEAAAPPADEPPAEPAAEAPAEPAAKVNGTSKRTKKKGNKTDLA